MKANAKQIVIPLFGIVILLFFQNCGQSNSGSTSAPSDSPFLSEGGDSLAGGGSARPIQMKTCTADPVLLIAGNQYVSNAFGTLTAPVLVNFDTATKRSNAVFPTAHYLFPSRSNSGNGQGLYGYDLSVAYDKASQPFLIGKESYAVRTRNCAYKSFVWKSMTESEEVVVNSNSLLSTENMVPYRVAATVVFESQIYSAINFVGTNDNSACSSGGSSVGAPTIPAIYNHTTKAITFLQTKSSPETVRDLIVENNQLVAIGLAPGGIPIAWKNGQRFESPLQQVGYTYFNASSGNYFFAGLNSEPNKTFLNVWKNATLKNRVEIPYRSTFVGFDADLNNTYALLIEYGTGRLYYLTNEQTEVTIDTSSFFGCGGIDIKSFNGKVYVLGSCTNQDKSRGYVVWIDGKVTDMRYPGNIQNTHTTRFEVGCNTRDGFYTDLDNGN